MSADLSASTAGREVSVVPSSDTQRAGCSCNSGRGLLRACLDLFRPEPAFVSVIPRIGVDQRGSASAVCSCFADETSLRDPCSKLLSPSPSVYSGKRSLCVSVLVPADVLCVFASVRHCQLFCRAWLWLSEAVEGAGGLHKTVQISELSEGLEVV